MSSRIKVTLTFTEEQVQPVDRIASRLGVDRAHAIRFLMWKGLESGQAISAIVDQADVLKAMADAMNREVEEARRMEEEIAGGLVAPPLEDKNVRTTNQGRQMT